MCREACKDEGPADREFSTILLSKHSDRCFAGCLHQAVGTADSRFHRDIVGKHIEKTCLTDSVGQSLKSGFYCKEFCAIDFPILNDVTVQGTDVIWYGTISSNTALPLNTVLNNGDTYYATQTLSGCESDTRLAVEININDPAFPTGNNTLVPS